MPLIRRVRRRTVIATALALMFAGATSVLTPTPAVVAQPATHRSHAAEATAEVISDDAVYQSRRTQGGGVYDPESRTTYVVWNAGAMDIYLRGYDHHARTWGKPVLIAEWGNTGTWAYHDYAVLTLLPNGHLAIYASHHVQDVVQFVAPTPHSLEGTWTRSTVTTDLAAYPEPVVVGDTVHLFYSRNDDQAWPYRTYKVITSSDNGASWSGPRNIIDTGRTDDLFNQVYVKSADAIGDRACLTWTLAGGPGGHNAESQNLYGACFDPTTARMQTLAGASLGATVDAGDLAAVLLLEAPTSTAAKHPVPLASLAEDPRTGRIIVGVGVTIDGVGTVRAGWAADDGIEWTTVVESSSRFRDMTWSRNGVEILSLGRATPTVRADHVSPHHVKNLWEIEIPYGDSGADTAYTATYVENRSTISAVLSTIDESERTKDYTGSWPVVALFD